MNQLWLSVFGENILVSNEYKSSTSSLSLLIKEEMNKRGIFSYYFKLDNPLPLIIDIRIRCFGGKGGFGSQLKAEGNKMGGKGKSGNYDSCRYLSGETVREVRERREINEYLARKPELDRKREEERRKKLEKKDSITKNALFTDVKYLNMIKNSVDNIETSLYENIDAYFDTDEETFSDDEINQ